MRTGWADLKFFYAAGVDRGEARVVARLADGTPLLIDKQMGEGHVLLFASGFDNLTNDLPLNPAFVAFVDQTARYLVGRGAGEWGAGWWTRLCSCGRLRREPADQGARVEIIGPDGKRPLSLREAATAQSFQLAQRGSTRFGLRMGGMR